MTVESLFTTVLMPKFKELFPGGNPDGFQLSQFEYLEQYKSHRFAFSKIPLELSPVLSHTFKEMFLQVECVIHDDCERIEIRLDYSWSHKNGGFNGHGIAWVWMPDTNWQQV